MSDLEALRARVAAAQESLSQTGDQRRQQSAQLAALIGTVEAALAQKQSEIAEFQDTIEALRAENSQLRDLLEGLISAIEATSQDEVRAAVAGLDSALAAITGGAAPTENSAEEIGAGEEPASPDAEAGDDLALEMIDEIAIETDEEGSGPSADEAAANEAIAEAAMEPVVPGGGPDDGLLADIEAVAAEGDGELMAENEHAETDDSDFGMIVEAADVEDGFDVEIAAESEDLIEAEAGGIEITTEGTVEAAETDSPISADEQPAATIETREDPDVFNHPPGDPARVKEIIDRVSRLADEMSSVAGADATDEAAGEASAAVEESVDSEARAAQV